LPLLLRQLSPLPDDDIIGDDIIEARREARESKSKSETATKETKAKKSTSPSKKAKKELKH